MANDVSHQLISRAAFVQPANHFLLSLFGLTFLYAALMMVAIVWFYGRETTGKNSLEPEFCSVLNRSSKPYACGALRARRLQRGFWPLATPRATRTPLSVGSWKLRRMRPNRNREMRMGGKK